MKPRIRTLIDLGKRIKDKVSEDDLSGSAAELAYRFFLAIFPFFIFLAALGGFVASSIDVENPTDEIMELLGESLPSDTASVIRTQLEGIIDNQSGGLLTVGVLGTIWASSSAIGALMKTLNRVYSVAEDRNLIARYAIALGLTIMSAGTIVLAFVILFVGQIYGPEIAGEIGLEDTASWVISLARLPAAIMLIMLAMAFLYWMAPNTRLPLAWISPGAIFFTIAWLIATFGFGIYVSNFGSYNATYGALGAVVVLLIWFYLTAFLILLGAEINSLIVEKRLEDEEGHTLPPRTPDEQQTVAAQDAAATSRSPNSAP